MSDKKSRPMNCPGCGAVMNYHADKVDYSDSDQADLVFGGTVEEVHTCPKCGRVELSKNDGLERAGAE